MLIVESYALGASESQRRRISVPIPPLSDCEGEGGDWRVRDLIAAVVRREVEEESLRRTHRRIPRVLSDDELAEANTRGKLDSGGNATAPSINLEDQVRDAWNSFESGEYLVIVEGQKCECLDERVSLISQDRVTFLRIRRLSSF